MSREEIESILKENRLGRRGKTLEDRFWEKVDKRSNDECWEWLGCRKVRYGRILITTDLKITAHRYSYFSYYRYYPSEEEYVCHKCDNVFCVNPHHLFLGTQKDNIQDMINKNRLPNRKGTKNNRCKLSEDSVRRLRKLYYSGEVCSRKRLVELFGIGYTQIQRILSGESWGWLE